MSSNPRILRLLGLLVDEHPEWHGAQLPTDEAEQRTLFRGLRNIRYAEPIGEEWLRLQDEELQQQLAEKGTVEVNETEASLVDSRLRLWQGDITRLKADAIVNAANSQMLGCFVPNHRCIDMPSILPLACSCARSAIGSSNCKGMKSRQDGPR